MSMSNWSRWDWSEAWEKAFKPYYHRMVEQINPTEMLPYLPCLSEADQQGIWCDQDRYGQRIAVQTLKGCLLRKGYPQEFLNALRRVKIYDLAETLEHALNAACHRAPTTTQAVTGQGVTNFIDCNVQIGDNNRMMVNQSGDDREDSSLEDSDATADNATTTPLNTLRLDERVIGSPVNAATKSRWEEGFDFSLVLSSKDEESSGEETMLKPCRYLRPDSQSADDDGGHISHLTEMFESKQDVCGTTGDYRDCSDVSPIQDKDCSDVSPIQDKDCSDVSPIQDKDCSDVSPIQDKDCSDVSPIQYKDSSDVNLLQDKDSSGDSYVQDKDSSDGNLVQVKDSSDVRCVQDTSDHSDDFVQDNNDDADSSMKNADKRDDCTKTNRLLSALVAAIVAVTGVVIFIKLQRV